jgi:hypothetical protein
VTEVLVWYKGALGGMPGENKGNKKFQRRNQTRYLPYMKQERSTLYHGDQFISMNENKLRTITLKSALELFTAMKFQVAVFHVVTPCSDVGGYHINLESKLIKS